METLTGRKSDLIAPISLAPPRAICRQVGPLIRPPLLRREASSSASETQQQMGRDDPRLPTQYRADCRTPSVRRIVAGRGPSGGSVRPLARPARTMPGTPLASGTSRTYRGFPSMWPIDPCAGDYEPCHQTCPRCPTRSLNSTDVIQFPGGGSGAQSPAA